MGGIMIKSRDLNKKSVCGEVTAHAEVKRVNKKGSEFNVKHR
jgi:hypothetical protein